MLPVVVVVETVAVPTAAAQASAQAELAEITRRVLAARTRTHQELSAAGLGAVRTDYPIEICLAGTGLKFLVLALAGVAVEIRREAALSNLVGCMVGVPAAALLVPVA